MKVTARRRQGYAHSLAARHHTLISDEPESKGGSDTGPDPLELLAASLAACTAITIEMYAARKEWELGAVEVDVEYQSERPGQARYMVEITVPAELSDDQRERLGVIAGRCPVHRLLAGGDVEIADRIV